MQSHNILTLDMISKFKDKRVLHSDFKFGEKLLEELIELSPFLNDSYIVTIYARPGLGKSTLFSDLQLKYPSHEEKDKDGTRVIRPVVIISADETCTVRKVVDSMCRAMDRPHTSLANASYLKTKAIQALKESKTLLLGIDEAQEFLNQSNRSGVKPVISFVRSLADITKIPLVLMGTPDYEDFVSTYEDMRRRVKCSHHIRVMNSPLDANTQFYHTCEGMLSNLHAITGRSLCPSVNRLEFSQRLFLVTGGRIGCIYDFLAQYIHDQYKSGANKVTFNLSDCENVLNQYLAPFPLVKPQNKAFSLAPSKLPGLMEKFQVMKDHI